MPACRLSASLCFALGRSWWIVSTGFRRIPSFGLRRNRRITLILPGTALSVLVLRNKCQETIRHDGARELVDTAFVTLVKPNAFVDYREEHHTGPRGVGILEL